MKKIIAVEWLSLDGFFSGPKGETDWFVMDEGTGKYLSNLFKTIDTIMLGQVTFNMFSAYWPKPDPADGNPKELTDFMNNSQKIVFSKSLKKTDWNNSVIIKDISAVKINKLKQETGKNIVIFGSGSIVSKLTKLGLIDEYQFLVNPVFLGNGKTIFKTKEAKSKLKLLNAKKFEGGNMMLHYEAENK
jgi:dihydrofolate reductase